MTRKGRELKVAVQDRRGRFLSVAVAELLGTSILDAADLAAWHGSEREGMREKEKE